MVERPDGGPDHQAQAREAPDVLPRKARSTPSPRHRRLLARTPPRLRQSRVWMRIDRPRIVSDRLATNPHIVERGECSPPARAIAYSITLSARARSDCGIVRPSAL